MRLVPVLLAVLALTACGGGTQPDGALVDADTTGAAALLGAFADGSVPDAFARLAAQPYRVDVTMTEVDPDASDDGDKLGDFWQTLEVIPGEPPRVVTETARNSLADSAGLDPARLVPRDPFAELLPSPPRFLDRRGAYRIAVTATPLGPEVRATVADRAAGRSGGRPLVQGATVSPLTDTRRRLSVRRTHTTADSSAQVSASVELSRGRGATPAAELPQTVTTRVVTETPRQRRHVVTTWRIQPLDAPRATNTREP